MKKICKKITAITVTMAIICTMLGTLSYAVSSTQNTKTNSNTKSSSKKTTSENQNKYEGEGLKSLKIGELQLSPEFNTETYEYTVKYVGEDTKLQIDATATESYYDIEIIGNVQLEEGENLITILVTDQDEENVATYQLTINKSLVDEAEVARKKEEERKQNLMVKVAGGLSAGIILILIIMGIVKLIKNRRNNWEDEEYEEDYEEYDEELPRALRHDNNKGKRYK